jgi:hypothetical protein
MRTSRHSSPARVPPRPQHNPTHQAHSARTGPRHGVRPLCAPTIRPAPLLPASPLRAEPSAPLLISPPPQGDPEAEIRSGADGKPKQRQSQDQRLGQGQSQNLLVEQADVQVTRNRTPAVETVPQASTRPARNRTSADRNTCTGRTPRRRGTSDSTGQTTTCTGGNGCRAPSDGPAAELWCSGLPGWIDWSKSGRRREYAPPASTFDQI